MKNLLVLFLLLKPTTSIFAQVDGGSTLIAQDQDGKILQKQIRKAHNHVLAFTKYLLKKEAKCGKKTGLSTSGTNLKEIHLKLLTYQTTHSSPGLCGKRDELFSCFRDKKYKILLDKMVGSPGLLPYLILEHQMNKKEIIEMISFFRNFGTKSPGA